MSAATGRSQAPRSATAEPVRGPRRQSQPGVRLDPRPPILPTAEHWTDAGARGEPDPPADLEGLLSEALKYVEAIVDGRSRSSLEPLSPTLRRALDLYSMEAGPAAQLEAALPARLAGGREILARLVREAEEENARQEAYWSETGAERPAHPASRCGAVADGVACALAKGHGGPHSALFEWD